MPQIAHTVDALLAAYATPGASVAVLVDGTLVHHAAHGSRDLDLHTPLDPAAPLPIYSVTKTLIATLILYYVEQNALSLDAPVQRYLPDLPLLPALSLRQLLDHTSGLPDYGDLPAYTAALHADPTRPWSDATFLEQTLTRGMRFVPGTGWAYSNLGYLLLRQVLEQVGNAPFADLVQAHLSEPLGSPTLRVLRDLDDMARMAPGYSSSRAPNAPLADVRDWYHPGWVAHGLVGASALAIAQLLDAIFAGTLLSAASRALMWHAAALPLQHPLFGQPAYGLGVMVDLRSPLGLLVGHGGGGPGYAAGALHLPAAHGQRITCVALANRDQPDLGLQIAHAVIFKALAQ
jgi:D-alanyl-D-alanine carboxypeptidase